MAQTGFTSRSESFIQFLTVFLVFILILVLTYYTTKFVGGFQKSFSSNRNIEAIETFKITNGKYLQLVRVGNKYVLIGIAKDSINTICEIAEEDLDLSLNDKPQATESFKMIMEKARSYMDKGNKGNE